MFGFLKAGLYDLFHAGILVFMIGQFSWTFAEIFFFLFKIFKNCSILKWLLSLINFDIKLINSKFKEFWVTDFIFLQKFLYMTFIFFKRKFLNVLDMFVQQKWLLLILISRVPFKKIKLSCFFSWNSILSPWW